jgi:hypothetical protein
MPNTSNTTEQFYDFPPEECLARYTPGGKGFIKPYDGEEFEANTEGPSDGKFWSAVIHGKPISKEKYDARQKVSN